MELINQLLNFVKTLFDWWFVVMPWEQAIHVRAGKHSKLKTAGLYFKIPFIDAVFVQTTRMRRIDLSAQTVSTLDGKTITIKSSIGYVIGDMEKLYNTMSHPESTLANIAMGKVAQYIRGLDSTKVSPKDIEEYVNSSIDASLFGLKDVTLQITSWADVKTFRLIQDQSWIGETLNMDPRK